jgi:protein involved in polysaccharide export with SLBB domain
MFVINEDMSIYANRGDIVFFSVTADEGGVNYKFKPGDVVRFTVYGKKDANNVLLFKDIPVFEETESVSVYLGEEDTRFDDVISKPTDYWYEIELNPDTAPQTIIGYDEDGAKIFRLYPEGNT